MPSYLAEVAPAGDVWVIRVSGVPGTASVPDLEDVDRIARKFVALNTGTPLGEVEVVVDVRAPEVRPGGRYAAVVAPVRWLRDRLDARSA